MAKNATLDDVARLCGVSKATVSYVLNGKHTELSVSEQTISKVIAASEKLCYKPDLTAVALSNQKRRPLSLLIISPWLYSQYSDFMAQVFSSLNEINRERDLKITYQLYTGGSLYKVLKPSAAVKYDATIIIGTANKDDDYLKESASGFNNVILLNRCVDGYPCVYGNDFDVTYTLAKKIVESSYYERYIVVSEGDSSFCREARLRALRSALDGVDYIDLDLNGGEFENEKSLTEFLGRFRDGRCCFFFTRFNLAALFMTATLRYGVRIPEKYGITGYDRNVMLERFIAKQLTTIDPHISDMTHRAVGIAEKLKTGEKVSNLIIQAEIIEGETVFRTDK